jgi:hypothetical protein
MRIVIAEDSAVVRAGLVEILADSGHEVVAAVGNAEDLLVAIDRPGPLSRRPPPGPGRPPLPGVLTGDTANTNLRMRLPAGSVG